MPYLVPTLGKQLHDIVGWGVAHELDSESIF